MRLRSTRVHVASADETAGGDVANGLGNRVRRGLRVALPYLAVLGVAFVGYGRTFDVPWYLDDLPWIVKDPVVHDLGRALRELTSARGLTTLTFAVDMARGSGGPAAFHGTNLAIHVAAGWLAFVVLRRLFLGRAEPALFGALLFVAHPIQSQAVTYVIQRASSLAALLCLGATALFLRGEAERSAGAPLRSARVAGPFLAALGLGCVALQAKQNAAVLPALLGVIVVFAPAVSAAAQQSAWRRLAPVLPFVVAPVLVGAWSLGPGRVTGPGGWMVRIDPDVVAAAGGVSSLGYLSTQMEVIWRYLRLLVLPVGQVFDMGLAVSTGPWRPAAVAGAAGLLGLVAVALLVRRRVPLLAFAVLWFLAAISVESSLIPMDPYFEHRVYLAVLGPCALAAALWSAITNARARAVVAVGLVGTLLVLTVRRNEVWRDPARLFEADLANGSISYRSAMGAADARLQQGDVERANAAYRVLLARGGDRCSETTCGGIYLYNLGVAAERLGDLPLAERFYAQAVGVAPSYATARIGLGIVAYRSGRVREAVDHFSQAARLEPGDPLALFNYCTAALELGDPSPSRANLARLRALDPARAAALEADLERRFGR